MHSDVSETVRIDRRFNGPPGSANGGYACGVTAGLLPGTARVTLRCPPPLDTELTVHRTSDEVELRDGDELVIEAEAAELAIAAPPDTVTFDAAVEASRDYAFFERHPFPTCFVCGPDRPEGDGLAIYPGRVAGTDLHAAPFVPDMSVGDRSGHVVPEVVWAALDCPSSFGFTGLGVLGVLGQLTARIDAPIEVGSRYVTIGWPLSRDGRKLRGASAITDEEGRLVAIAEATWVILRDQPEV